MTATTILFLAMLGVAIYSAVGWLRCTRNSVPNTEHEEALRVAKKKLQNALNRLSRRAAISVEDLAKLVADHEKELEKEQAKIAPLNDTITQFRARIADEGEFPQGHYAEGLRRVLSFFYNRLYQDKRPEIETAIRHIEAQMARIPKNPELNADDSPLSLVEAKAFSAGFLAGRWIVQEASREPVWATLVEQLWPLCNQQRRRELLRGSGPFRRGGGGGGGPMPLPEPPEPTDTGSVPTP